MVSSSVIKLKCCSIITIIMAVTLLCVVGRFARSEKAASTTTTKALKNPRVQGEANKKNVSTNSMVIRDSVADLARLSTSLSAPKGPLESLDNNKNQVSPDDHQQDQLVAANFDSPFVLPNGATNFEAMSKPPSVGMHLLPGKRRLDGEILDTVNLGHSIMLASGSGNEHLIAPPRRGSKPSGGSGSNMHNKIVDNGSPPLYGDSYLSPMSGLNDINEPISNFNGFVLSQNKMLQPTRRRYSQQSRTSNPFRVTHDALRQAALTKALDYDRLSQFDQNDYSGGGGGGSGGGGSESGAISSQESRRRQQMGGGGGDGEDQTLNQTPRRRSSLGSSGNDNVRDVEEDGELASDRRSDAFDKNDDDNDDVGGETDNDKPRGGSKRATGSRRTRVGAALGGFDGHNNEQILDNRSDEDGDDGDGDGNAEDEDEQQQQKFSNGRPTRSKAGSGRGGGFGAANKRQDDLSPHSINHRRGLGSSDALWGRKSEQQSMRSQTRSQMSRDYNQAPGRGATNIDNDNDDNEEDAESSVSHRDQIELASPIGVPLGQTTKETLTLRRSDALELAPWSGIAGDSSSAATTSPATGGDLQTAAGHHHGHDHHHYYQYVEVPKKKAWKFGFKRGNHKHEIERHEKGHKSKFHSSFKWHAKEKCKKKKKCKSVGKMTWDYKHHDKKHHH